MIYHRMGKARKNSIAALSRLLIACVLLSGGPTFRSPSMCVVLAQGGNKNNDKNKDKNNDKDKNKDRNKNKNNDKGKNQNAETELLTESASSQPSFLPTSYPTLWPTMDPTYLPTYLPTMFPTPSLKEPLATDGRSELPPTNLQQARLPTISIDVTMVVNDIYMFAALLLGRGTSDQGQGNANTNGVQVYFENFVTDMLLVSEVIEPSSLESVDIDVKFLPLEFEEMSRTPTTRNIPPDRTPLRISIAGKMNYMSEEGQETSDQSDISVLEDQISYTLAAYFTFWSTDEMRASLSEYGLMDPVITAVRVADNLILVASDSNPMLARENNQDSLLVVKGSFSSNEASGSSRRTMDHLPSFAATMGLIFLGGIIFA